MVRPIIEIVFCNLPKIISYKKDKKMMLFHLFFLITLLELLYYDNLVLLQVF